MQELPISDNALFFDLSRSEKYLVAGFKLGVSIIYEKINGTYQKLQEFTDSIEDIEGVSISDDEEIIGFGDWDRKVFIYKKSGSLFYLNQTISLSFKVNHIKITS